MAVNVNFQALAIYNTDEQRLAYITYSIAEATKLIFGQTNINENERLRRALKSKGKVSKGINSIGFNVFVREATVKQMALLGKQKSVKINEKGEVEK